MNLFIEKASSRAARISLVHPFRTAKGQHDLIENVFFKLTLSNGISGWGEAGIAEHITGETVAGTLRLLKRIAATLPGFDPVKLLPLPPDLRSLFLHHRAALAAVETALMDALTRSWKMPLWRFFGSRPKVFQTDMTLVISGEEDCLNFAGKIWARGIRKFKIKVGRDTDSDLKRVIAISKKFPGAKLLIDANQGFSADETLRFLKSLAARDICPELIEQPVAKGDWAGLEKVTRSVRIPVMADESASSLADVRHIIRSRAASGINIKLMKFGLFDAWTAVVLAKTAGLKLMIGQMMESMIAVSAAAQLAAGLGNFDFYDLDSVFFISQKSSSGFQPEKNGRYDVKKIRAGLGVLPLYD